MPEQPEGLEGDGLSTMFLVGPGARAGPACRRAIERDTPDVRDVLDHVPDPSHRNQFTTSMGEIK